MNSVVKKMRVAIVFGGQSAEHEVSLQSARNIVEALDREKFNPVLIGIDKKGKWHLSDDSHYLLNQDRPESIALHQTNREVALAPGRKCDQWLEVQTGKLMQQIDVVFPIAHGSFGEDGSLQGLLKMAGLPFVGSDVLGSAVCMDKAVAKQLLHGAGLPVTPYVALGRAEAAQTSFSEISGRLGLPVFVKPANLGSSVGVSKVATQEEYSAALELAFSYDHKVLVECAIQGREIECAVMGNDGPIASGCGEIVVRSGFYSYDVKYIDENAASVVVPAEIEWEASERIRKLAVLAFCVLQCAGLARVDFFLKDNGEVLINEVNTLPGFTNISMFPALWREAGMSYQDLITRLIELAIERHQRDSMLRRAL